jgi:hypothetical protein
VEKIHRKLAEATEVSHEATFCVNIDLVRVGITDKFDQAAVAVSVGAVNAARNTTRLIGSTLVITFMPVGLGATKARAEATEMYSSIRHIIAHKAKVVHDAAQKAAEEAALTAEMAVAEA